MPAARIIGLPSSGAKTLRRVDYSTERNGLETLTETYTIRTADRATLQPTFNAPHTSFSKNSTLYPRMVVENFNVRAQDGDISELTVTFVGLTSTSGLPGALIRVLPAPPKVVYQVEFLSAQTESELIASATVLTRMPVTINGTVMPYNRPFTTNFDNSRSFYGYTYSTTEAIRRGLFLVCTVVFAEYNIIY